MTNQDIRVKITADGAAQAGAAFGRVAGDLRKVGESAGFTKAQLQQANFQVTDIVTSLLSGQRPFTVLVQQGGQLKDAFGGVGGAVRAVSAAVGGMVNPFTLAGAAALGLGYALFKGAEQSEEFNKKMALTGNYAELTENKLQAMAEAQSARTRRTITEQRDTITALASTGLFEAKALDDASRAMSAYQRLTGQTAEEAVGHFEGIAAGAAKWAAEQNRSVHFLTEEQYKHIRALEEHGQKVEAIRLALKLFADDVEQRQVPAVGYLTRVWNFWGRTIDSVGQSLMNIGKPDTVTDQLASATERLAKAQASLDEAERNGRLKDLIAERRKALEIAKAEVDNLQARLSLEKSGAAARAEIARREGSKIDKLTGPQKAPPKDYLGDMEDGFKRRLETYWERNQAAMDAAEEKERAQVATLAEQLSEQTAQLNVSLIADDRARGEAQIEIERQTAQAKIDILWSTGVDITDAQEALNANIVAKQRALTEQLKPEWQRMVDGWKDATRTMRETYDAAMNGILRDSEDAFVKLMRTGKLDLKSLSGNLADTLWRGYFRQNIGPGVSNGAQSLFAAFGMSRTGGGFKPEVAGEWSDELGKLIGITDKQATATDMATRAVQEFSKGLDSVSSTFSDATSAVIQFLTSLTSSSGGGGGGGFLGMLGQLFGGSDSGSSGMTSGNMGLADYGLGGGRAFGGPVRAGFDYTVGENGPETLRMFRGGGGHVVPNAGGRGGGDNHNHYYQAGVSPAQMQAYGEAIEARVINRVYNDLARPGRPLYRAVRT